MTNLASSIYLPAYNTQHSSFIYKLTLKARDGDYSKIKATGSIGVALKKNFERILYIMTSIKSEWESLNLLEYELSCTNPNVVVKDSRSSSLSLAIALINIHRQKLKRPISNLIGTGLVRIDGSIEGSSYEELKIQALKENDKFTTPTILTSKQCGHLFELDTYMK